MEVSRDHIAWSIWIRKSVLNIHSFVLTTKQVALSVVYCFHPLKIKKTLEEWKWLSISSSFFSEALFKHFFKLKIKYGRSNQQSRRYYSWCLQKNLASSMVIIQIYLSLYLIIYSFQVLSSIISSITWCCRFCWICFCPNESRTIITQCFIYTFTWCCW
jgi:hypothetical protein